MSEAHEEESPHTQATEDPGPPEPVLEVPIPAPQDIKILETADDIQHRRSEASIFRVFFWSARYRFINVGGCIYANAYIYIDVVYTLCMHA